MPMHTRALGTGVVLVLSTSLLAGCGSGDEDGTVTLNVATVNNPQMKDMEELASQYEAANPGVQVEFQVMEESDLRSTVTADVASGAGQYDIVTIGAYETPQWGANGWLVDLSSLGEDPDYDVEDILPSVRAALTHDDKLYAVPFYGESSILMYNKEILAAAGVTMSDQPTWQEVAEAAAAVDSEETAGICMRGKPGWGDLFAPLTTVVQTFGGNWYDEEWNATVDTPQWREAVTFYKEMLDASGQSDPVSYSFNECLTAVKEGKAAMWADASVAASILEADDSPVKGRMGYAHMPVVETEESGWLWSWNLAVPTSSGDREEAQDFVKWATSKEYVRLVGEELGWSLVPPGSRTSTYALPEYQQAASAYAPITLEVMTAVDPEQPGVEPQPWVGVQYVSIPEFQDVGNQCAQLVADYLADRTSVDEALASCQDIAQEAAEPHRE